MSEPKMTRVKPIGAEGPILEVEVRDEWTDYWWARLTPTMTPVPLYKSEWKLVETTVDKLNKLGVHAVVVLRVHDARAPFVRNQEGAWRHGGLLYPAEHVAGYIDNDGWEVIFTGLEES